MRTKAHRYSATVPAATFTDGTDCIGITGDFDGGLVLATVVVAVNAGANWVGVRFKVDGVPQGPTQGNYQYGGSMCAIHAWTLRVPQGRHRISVYFGTTSPPIPSGAADLSVAELNA
jgi:multisubunit Na+/H+ antiporter MnhB subunit